MGRGGGGERGTRSEKGRERVNGKGKGQELSAVPVFSESNLMICI